MKRLVLFLATNSAVLLVVWFVFELIGLEPQLSQSESGIDLRGVLVLTALIGIGGSFVSLALSKWVARNAMGIHMIGYPKTNQERWLRNTVEQLARDTGTGTPSVGIFPSSTPNAFAIGMSRDNALVAVSTGLLEHMPHDQVEAVLAHEISHVANGDMVTLGLLQGVVNTFVYYPARIVGILVDRTLFRNRRGKGVAYFTTTLLAQVFLSFLATLIVMAFSRWREYRADAGGARLAGREYMIGALRSLQDIQKPPPLRANMRAFGIAGGRPRKLMCRLLVNHPPLENRIAALQRTADQGWEFSRGQ